eukprot:3853850-Pleurochrysis_carterae.AAC.2
MPAIPRESQYPVTRKASFGSIDLCRVESQNLVKLAPARHALVVLLVRTGRQWETKAKAGSRPEQGQGVVLLHGACAA